MSNNAGMILKTVLSAIGTSGCLAVAGALAARRGLITDAGRKIMAELSMNLLMPLLLFTGTLEVKPGADYTPIAVLIRDCWILLILPLFVVFSGMALGKLVAALTPCPQDFGKACVGAVAFANSTGMSITLLQVLSPALLAEDLLDRDPLKFLPVYLLLYPMLQWTIGSYLFGLLGGPKEEADELDGNQDAEMGAVPAPTAPAAPLSRVRTTGSARSRASPVSRISSGLPELDFASDPDFYPLDVRPWRTSEEVQAAAAALREESEESEESEEGEEGDARAKKTTAVLIMAAAKKAVKSVCRLAIAKTVLKFIRNGLVPPVIGCVCGIVVSLIEPLHEVFVDTVGLQQTGVNGAPLAFAFTAMKTIGAASVPMNMLVLGSNLSKGCDFKAIPISTNLGILFMKNIGQPAVMALAIFFLSRAFPDDLAVWLVAMVVSCTPTANNIMVMVELSGQNKAGVTTCIFTQYMAAPFVLTLVISTFLLYKDFLAPSL